LDSFPSSSFTKDELGLPMPAGRATSIPLSRLLPLSHSCRASSSIGHLVSSANGTASRHNKKNDKTRADANGKPEYVESPTACFRQYSAKRMRCLSSSIPWLIQICWFTTTLQLFADKARDLVTKIDIERVGESSNSLLLFPHNPYLNTIH
jgi:hypothetical protein